MSTEKAEPVCPVGGVRSGPTAVGNGTGGTENPRGQSKQIHTQVWSVLTLQCHSALEGCGVRLTLRGGSALTTLLSETLLRQKDEVAGDPEGREVVHHFTDVIAPLSYTTECSGRDAEPCG